MGARAVRVVDWTSRGCRVALAASLVVVAVGAASDLGYTVPLEVAIERGLAEAAPAERLEARARAALEADDVDLARGFADLGQQLGRPLTAETLARLSAAEAPAAVAMRNARGAARGFATGEIDGTASLAGAIAADLTVIGDLRDLAREGVARAKGEEHSDLILGLAAAGVAVTAATYVSAGGAAPARFSLSVLKAARRTGAMTAEFAADLGRRFAKAAGRTADAAPEASRGARALGALSGPAADLRAVGSAVGTAETVRMMKYVRTVDDLPDLRRFAERFGARSRAVAEVMGRASLRAFRTTVRFAELIAKHLIAIAMWLGGLLAGAVSNVAWRGVRFFAARV
ncbi:hypothetical protein [Chenggangzhangella methanolivorans]|uniref:Uncharacterized protein n=1 Tax=Chenggangzhangella methanolivorans TaxID=1437009 RepID=A0A9E6R874_9HYPH|nr:hypothetical protein [Chenggangzhangella methanolivorans]QZN98613.1 hypothetical protein K6K41_16440 [Chenggangzhangella methanolivorans]